MYRTDRPKRVISHPPEPDPQLLQIGCVIIGEIVHRRPTGQLSWPYVWTNANLQERAVCFRLQPDEPVQNVIHDREQDRAEDCWEAPDDTEPRHHS
jgi:hypothetical protein